MSDLKETIEKLKDSGSIGLIDLKSLKKSDLDKLSEEIKYWYPRVQEFFDGTATVLWPRIGSEELRAFLAAEVPRIAALIARSGARAG